MLARPFHSVGDRLQLELPNQVVEPHNQQAHRTIAANCIIDSLRKIVYGGNYYNFMNQLQQSDLVPDDENMHYSFHFCRPTLFSRSTLRERGTRSPRQRDGTIRSAFWHFLARARRRLHPIRAALIPSMIGTDLRHCPVSDRSRPTT